VGGEPRDTSGSIHGLGYLFSALRREGLIADELILQLEKAGTDQPSINKVISLRLNSSVGNLIIVGGSV
jgi:hypothetical protein